MTHVPGAMRIFAHRGASHDAPENTLAAFELGWRQGADGAELDVHLSRDGRIIVCHDADTYRTTGRRRTIDATAAADLADLPQLGDVVRALPPDRALFVEIKCGPEIVPVLLAARLPVERIGFLCFDGAVLSVAKAALPLHRCLLNVEPGRYTAASLLRMSDGFDGVSLGWHASISPGLVEDLHQAGKRVAVWTVDDPAVACAARLAHVDILMTNRPEQIRHALAAADSRIPNPEP